MINSLLYSLLRVTLFWYVLGALVLFLGHPDWAEAIYLRLQWFPWVPEVELKGLSTAASVQWNLLAYWTLPIVVLWAVSLVSGVVSSEFKHRLVVRARTKELSPSGEFWGVKIPSYSIGQLPAATTPSLTGQKVVFADGANANQLGLARVTVTGAVSSIVKLMTVAERHLAEELLQLLLTAPNHFAGLGHGVGLLEHTLNVASEAAGKCNAEFRLPLLAALAHDIGKLVTFVPDGEGGWERKGLHSREGARILATLPSFQEIPELHQRALMLTVKYDHAPEKMPELRGDRDASMLAFRIISALSQADKKATAEEKERNLKKIRPEDILWKDFCDFLREAPVVQQGKKGAANQVNNPPDSPYLFIYEASWRDAAIKRLPAEVSASLDVSRRDSGKIAKYTKLLVQRLREEDLLVESVAELHVSKANPLWDIKSGTGEKAVLIRAVIVLKADELWKKLNYRLSILSPFAVQVVAPNSDPGGHVNAPGRDTANREPEETLVVSNIQENGAEVGLAEKLENGAGPAQTARPKTRAKTGFKSEPPRVNDAELGLDGQVTKKTASVVPTDKPVADADTSTASAMAFLQAGAAPEQEHTPPAAEPAKVASATEPTPVQVEAVAEKTAEVEPEIELSRAEKREGLAVADEDVVVKYPDLEVGDKYYTDTSRAVLSGIKKPGSKYRGDKEPKALNLTESGPRRARRKIG